MKSPNKIQSSQSNLAIKIAQLTKDLNRFDTPIEGLSLHQWDAPTEPTSYLHEASLCMIAQGKKQVMLGEESYVYDANHFLFSAVDLPIVSRIMEASSEHPYLGVILHLDTRIIAQMMVDSHVLNTVQEKNGRRGMAIGDASPALLNAFVRLLDLLDTPQDIPVLAPLIQKEIYYRLLVSPQGLRLRQIVTLGSQGQRIARAIDWLKSHFADTLRVEELAISSGMSPSSFHQHFKGVTSMSPLQYQKRLRLSEARRLMFTQRLDAAVAAHQVGYESPSQFSREYSRHFGASPSRDIRALQAIALD